MHFSIGKCKKTYSTALLTINFIIFAMLIAS